MKNQDELYLARLYNGESQAFSYLYEKYKEKIYNYIRNLLLYDTHAASIITSDVFISIFEYSLKNKIENFNALAFKTAHNLSVNWMQKHKHETYFKDDNQLEQIEDTSYWDLNIELNQSYTSEIMQNCLEHLSIQQRELLYLYYFENKDYNQIASLLWSNKNSVWTLISRAKFKLKSIADSQWYTELFTS